MPSYALSSCITSTKSKLPSHPTHRLAADTDFASHPHRRRAPSARSSSPAPSHFWPRDPPAKSPRSCGPNFRGGGGWMAKMGEDWEHSNWHLQGMGEEWRRSVLLH